MSLRWTWILLAGLPGCAFASDAWIAGLLGDSRGSEVADTGMRSAAASDDTAAPGDARDSGRTDSGSPGPGDCPDEDPLDREDNDCDGVITIHTAGADRTLAPVGTGFGGAVAVAGPILGGTELVMAVGPQAGLTGGGSVLVQTLAELDAGTAASRRVLVGDADEFGAALTPLPRIGGSLIPGLAVSAFRDEGSGRLEGAVYLFGGPISDELTVDDATRLVGNRPAHLAGGALASVDLAGDACADLVIGAPRPGTTDGGAVLFLDPGCGDTPIPTSTVSAWGRVYHGVASARFGTALSAVGDVDGDGLADLAAGAPGNSTVHLLADPPAGVVAVNDAAVATLTGADDAAGSSLAAAGDLNSDGYADLWVGQPDGEDGGSVSLVLGAATPADGVLAASAARLVGGEHRLGHGVSGDGDFDGDGVLDVAAVHCGGCASTTPSPLQAWVWLGPLSGVSTPEDARVHLLDAETDQGAGARVRFVVDTTGDGRDELWLGAPNLADGAGAAWWIRGFAAAD